MALLLAWTHAASAAANVWPSGPAQVTVGQTFNVVVQVNGAKDVDTVRLNGSFTQDLLQYKSAQPTGIFQNISPGTYVDQAKGEYSFGTFTLSSKANGTSRLAILTFKATKVGSAFVQLGTSSRVLSAGEDQMGTVGRLNIKVVEAVAKPAQPTTGEAVITLTSTSHSDPDTWYSNGSVIANWSISNRVPTKLYLGFDQDPQGPAETATTPAATGSQTFMAPTDGIWYVHAGAEFSDKSFERTDLRIQVDRMPPHPIAPMVDQTNVPSSIQNFLRFGTVDDASGIAKYDVYLDETLATTTQLTAYELVDQAAGTHTARVRAYDRAGNYSEGTTSFNIVNTVLPVTQPSIWQQFNYLLFILFAILALTFLLFWSSRTKKKKFKFKR